MTRHGDPLDDGRERFDDLVRRVVAYPIDETKKEFAFQLKSVDERLDEIHDDLRKTIKEHQRSAVSFQESAHKELATLRSGQDELRGTVQRIGEMLASAEGRLTTALRYLAALYVLLTVASGLVVVLLVKS